MQPEDSRRVDHQDAITRELVRRVLPLLVGVSVLAAGVPLVLAPEEPGRALPGFLGLLGTALAMVLLRRRRYRLVARIIVGMGLGVVALSMWLSGGVQAPGFVGVFTLVLVAAFMWSPRVAAGIVVSFLVLGGLSILIGVPPWEEPGPGFRLAIYGLWLLLTLILATSSIRVLTQAHARSLAHARELQRAQTALLGQQTLYEAVFKNANDAIFIMEGDRFVDCNEAALDIFGCSREQLLGESPVRFSPPQQPGGRASVELAEERIRGALEGEAQRFAWVHQRLDGQLFEAEVSLNRLLIKEQTLLLAVVRDVSAQRELERRLHHAERLDTVGQLAGGIAHDFKNVLAGILGAAELLRLDLPPESEDHRWLDLIYEAVESAADLTGKLLSFSRAQSMAAQPVSVHQAIHGAVSLLERTVDKRVRLEVLEEAEEDVVLGDLSDLQSVFLNLGLNAAQAMPEGGTLRFHTEVVELADGSYEHQAFDLEPGRHLRVHVSDTGTGIAKEHLERLFDPFFTTKAAGEGTGLGLAAVWGVVRQHRGAVQVETELGQGTVFHITLPLAGAELSPAPSEEERVRGQGTILVVDDDETVRHTARSLLEHLGYEVILAVDGLDGVRAYQEHRPELVILDMVMPEMSGRQAFERLRALDPEVRVLISSGFAREEDLRALRAQGVNGFVSKPYRLAALSRAVQQVLRGEG